MREGRYLRADRRQVTQAWFELENAAQRARWSAELLAGLGARSTALELERIFRQAASQGKKPRHIEARPPFVTDVDGFRHVPQA